MNRIMAYSFGLLLLGLAAVSLGSTPVKAQSSGGTLTLDFPTARILTPDKVYFGGNTYQFNTGNTPSLTLQSGSGAYSTAASFIANDDPNSQLDDHYQVVIGNIPKGDGIARVGNKLLATLNNLVTAKAYAPPPSGNLFYFLNLGDHPYGYKVTMREQVLISTVNQVASYLRAQGLVSGKHYMGDADCVGQTNGSHVCLATTVTLQVPERQTPLLQTLKQSVLADLPGVLEFEGNVAAPGEISGFVLKDTSSGIAIGGTIPADITGATTNVRNYIDQNATKFSWQNVQGQLNELFGKRTRGVTTTGTFGATWNLNASGNNPIESGSTSLSTPPEGKLWNVNGSLTLSAVNFKGSGTIVVQNDVIFNGPITCDTGTRLGIIAGGTITFNNPAIGCGAYTALGGNLTFNYTISSTNLEANGIFVARDSIDLPNLNVGSRYTIKYDRNFGVRPTVLFQELLRIVFSATS